MRARTLRLLVPLLVLASGQASALDIARGWMKPADKDGDAPMFLAIEGAAAPDLLLRIRCSASQFTELHVVDRGEGAPSMRTVKSIPIPAGTMSFAADGPHVMLLQLIQSVQPGDSFTCRATFRDAGPKDVAVAVQR